MEIDDVTKKSLQIMQALYSLGKINKKLIPLNKEFETNNLFEYFHIPDYYPIVYEDTICKIIELAVLLRRDKEKMDNYGEIINQKVKYSNIGKNIETKVDVAFDVALSKIIHSKNLYLLVKDSNGNLGYAYETDRNCEFTGILRIVAEEKDKTISTIDIDLEKLCVNAMMINARISF
ncbi:MAG: hypothetical protein ACI4MO_02275 [Christensenellales bacterium]